MPFVLLDGHLANNSWPALHSGKKSTRKTSDSPKGFLISDACTTCAPIVVSYRYISPQLESSEAFMEIDWFVKQT